MDKSNRCDEFTHEADRHHADFSRKLRIRPGNGRGPRNPDLNANDSAIVPAWTCENGLFKGTLESTIEPLSVRFGEQSGVRVREDSLADRVFTNNL